MLNNSNRSDNEELMIVDELVTQLAALEYLLASDSIKAKLSQIDYTVQCHTLCAGR